MIIKNVNWQLSKVHNKKFKNLDQNDQHFEPFCLLCFYDYFAECKQNNKLL